MQKITNELIENILTQSCNKTFTYYELLDFCKNVNISYQTLKKYFKVEKLEIIEPKELSLNDLVENYNECCNGYSTGYNHVYLKDNKIFYDTFYTIYTIKCANC